MTKLRLGTRASALARWQAHWVSEQLAAQGHELELIPITTHGDTADREAITALGGTGVFTKELERALLAGQIDLAVHSLKDLPTEPVEGLVLAAVPPREAPHDVLVSRHGLPLDQLPRGAAVGTGSLRRRAQLLHRRDDLQMRDIRGNVDTRLEKLAAGQYEAIVLALAGLRRLRLEDRATQVFDFQTMMPAVGQGALGIEARQDDAATRAALVPLDDRAAHQATLAERTLLATLAGGCLGPVGAHAAVQPDGSLRLEAVVLSVDGVRRLAAADTGSIDAPQELGAHVARDLLAQGAAALIDESRGS